MLKFIPTLTRLINNDIYRICSKLKKLKIIEISHGGERERKHNNRLCVSLDQFPIIYKAI